MAIFQGGNVQLVKPGDKLYFDKSEWEVGDIYGCD